MNSVLLQLANESYLVSPELARRVQDATPSDRYVTITPVKDTLEHPVLATQQPSIFERARQRQDDQPTDHEKAVARRWADHLAKRQQSPKQK
jgi:hypothetical protein